MADDDYCDNCDGVCDGCCGGTNKKYPTDEEEADHIVKIVMSNGPTIANLVLNKLIKQIQTNLPQKIKHDESLHK